MTDRVLATFQLEGIIREMLSVGSQLGIDDGGSHDEYTSQLKNKSVALHKLTEKVLIQELVHWNVPHDKSDDKQDLLSKVRRVQRWLAMDQASLRQECLMMNKVIPGDVSIQNVIDTIYRPKVSSHTAANNFPTVATLAPATTTAIAVRLPVLEAQSRTAGAPTSTRTIIENEMDTPVSSNICGVYTVVSANEVIGRVKMVYLSCDCDSVGIKAFHYDGVSEEISGITFLTLLWDTSQVVGLDTGNGQYQHSPGTGNDKCGVATIRWPDDSIWIKKREIKLDDLRQRNCTIVTD